MKETIWTAATIFALGTTPVYAQVESDTGLGSDSEVEQATDTCPELETTTEETTESREGSPTETENYQLLRPTSEWRGFFDGFITPDYAGPEDKLTLGAEAGMTGELSDELRLNLGAFYAHQRTHEDIIDDYLIHDWGLQLGIGFQSDEGIYAGFKGLFNQTHFTDQLEMTAESLGLGLELGFQKGNATLLGRVQGTSGEYDGRIFDYDEEGNRVATFDLNEEIGDRAYTRLHVGAEWDQQWTDLAEGVLGTTLYIGYDYSDFKDLIKTSATDIRGSVYLLSPGIGQAEAYGGVRFENQDLKIIAREEDVEWGYAGLNLLWMPDDNFGVRLNIEYDGETQTIAPTVGVYIPFGYERTQE